MKNINPNNKKDQMYHPIQQQSNDSLPRYMHQPEKNIARMVADTSRMSEEQIKKALEALYMPPSQSFRSGLPSFLNNNRLQDRSEAKMLADASKGDQAREEYFKMEQKAHEAQVSVDEKSEELGKLEKQLKSKESLQGAMQMREEHLNKEVASDSVELQLHGDKMEAGERAALEERLKGNSKKLAETKEKGAKLGSEIQNLKEKIAGLKGELEKQKGLAQSLAKAAKESAQKNAQAIQGSHRYQGDLL